MKKNFNMNWLKNALMSIIHQINGYKNIDNCFNSNNYFHIINMKKLYGIKEFMVGFDIYYYFKYQNEYIFIFINSLFIKII